MAVPGKPGIADPYLTDSERLAYLRSIAALPPNANLIEMHRALAEIAFLIRLLDAEQTR